MRYPTHFLYGYFFEATLYRHLPELLIFAACLVVHIWRRDYMQWPFPLIASLATLLIGFLLRHGNGFYVPFWYFPSFLLVFLTISVAWRAVAVPVLVLVLFVPQYAVAYVEGHKYADQGELQVARSAIASRGTDLSHAHIFGDSIFWPVFKDLSFEWAPSMSKQPPRYKLSDLWSRSAVLHLRTRMRRRAAGFQRYAARCAIFLGRPEVSDIRTPRVTPGRQNSTDRPWDDRLCRSAPLPPPPEPHWKAREYSPRRHRSGDVRLKRDRSCA